MEYEICTIQSPNKKWLAEISASLGANITKLQYGNNDVLVPLKSKEQLERDPFLIGCPILFPANRTYRGEFEFGGKKYKLPINDTLGVANLHGSLHYQEFEVVEVTQHKAILSFCNINDIYPFAFTITAEYSLENNTFKQVYTIKNTGDTEMPFTFALHTTFVEPKNFSVPLDLHQEENEQHIPTGRYIELTEQEKQYTGGCIPQNIYIAGYYSSCGNVAYIGDYKYAVSENFDHWVFYNAGGKDGFLCVEPQCGAVNGLNIQDGYKVISPMQEVRFITEISV